MNLIPKSKGLLYFAAPARHAISASMRMLCTILVAALLCGCNKPADSKVSKEVQLEYAKSLMLARAKANADASMAQLQRDLKHAGDPGYDPRMGQIILLESRLNTLEMEFDAYRALHP